MDTDFYNIAFEQMNSTHSHNIDMDAGESIKVKICLLYTSRQQERDNKVAFFEAQKENLKNRKADSLEEISEKPVSYTHLDVYKRQFHNNCGRYNLFVRYNKYIYQTKRKWQNANSYL